MINGKFGTILTLVKSVSTHSLKDVVYLFCNSYKIFSIYACVPRLFTPVSLYHLIALLDSYANYSV